MAFSLSGAVLLGIVVFVLLRLGYVRWGSALACTLFGFLLASTGLAPLITRGLVSLAGFVSGFTT
ncbi:hypothetical protein [Streptomyces sp. DB-54]